MNMCRIFVYDIYMLTPLVPTEPGGHLQWDESDVSSATFEKAQPDNKFEAVTRLYRLTQGLDSRLKPSWVPKIAELAESAGLCIVQVDKRDTTSTPAYLAYAMFESSINAIEQMARTNGNAIFAKELRELIPEVVEESRKGARWDFTRWTVVAKKSISSS